MTSRGWQGKFFAVEDGGLGRKVRWWTDDRDQTPNAAHVPPEAVARRRRRNAQARTSRKRNR